MAPSLLAFIWGFHFLPDSIDPQLHQHLVQAGGFVCFLYLIGGASRLARFNISHDAQPRNPGRPDRKYFVGMPIPAAAGMLAATVHFFYGIPVQAWWIAIPWLLLVGLSGFLMVSTWRFWSGKEINLSRSHPFQLLFLLSIVLYVVLRYSHVVFSQRRWFTCFRESGRARLIPGRAGADGRQQSVRGSASSEPGPATHL